MLNRHRVLILSGIYSTQPSTLANFVGFLCVHVKISLILSINLNDSAGKYEEGSSRSSLSWILSNFFFFPASKASFPLRANGVFSSKEFTLQGFPNSCGLKSLFTCSTLEISVIFNERTYMMNLIKGKWTVMRSGKKNPGISLYPFLWGTFSLK